MFFKKTMALLAAVLIVVSSGAVAVFAQEIEANRPVLQEVTITERNQGPELTPEPEPAPDPEPSNPPSPPVPEPEPNPELTNPLSPPVPKPKPNPEPNPPSPPVPDPEPKQEPTPQPEPYRSTAPATNKTTPATRRVTNTNAATKRTDSSSEAEASSSELTSALIPEDVSSDLVSLPDVGSLVLSVPNAMGSGTEAASGQGNHWYGVIAWVCIGVGVIIVLVILVIGNRRSPRRRNSVGRKRYHRKPFKSGKKHLLDDRYYSNKYRRR